MMWQDPHFGNLNMPSRALVAIWSACGIRKSLDHFYLLAYEQLSRQFSYRWGVNALFRSVFCDDEPPFRIRFRIG